jgi:hypothetical protein
MREKKRHDVQEECEKSRKNRQINIGDLGIVSVNEWNIGRDLPISGRQTDENRENIGSNIGRISA